MDIEEQAGTRGLKYAAERGLAVVVMEPLRGGKLAAPPEKVRRVWEAAPVRRTPADCALQWLWNQPEVSVVLSGMSSMQQVSENLASAQRSGIGTLNAAELGLFEQARDQFLGLSPIPCTKCEYCMPCPNGLNIPALFEWFNRGVMYESFDEARWRYEHLRPEERASACARCLQCEDLCPQRIPISEWMGRIHAVLGEKQPYVAAK
jgi:predicted aldo/keto reductase-like oxidoreductase